MRSSTSPLAAGAIALAFASNATAQQVPPASAPSGETPPSATNASTPPSTAAPAQNAAAAVQRFMEAFQFGSYGRVIAASDLRGRVGRPQNIVAYGTRLDEQTYAELELKRNDTFGAVRTRMVATLGITGPLFHDSGNWSISMAVRNLYIEERGALTPNLTLWAGSRMYRGDDIYLLNWWPLDNLNTVGGGGRYDFGEHFTLQAHVGANRLDTNYQRQSITVLPREGFFPVSVSVLDRPRVIGSLKATWWSAGRNAPDGFKLIGYAEGHGLPEGVRRNPESGSFETMPMDWGLVVGAQAGGYLSAPQAFFNVFFRYARGLAAYGDLAVPYTLTARQTSERAQDLVFAATGSWERDWFGFMVAGYARWFRDADAALYGRNDLVEGTVLVRPTAWISDHFGIWAEISYQGQQWNMLDPTTLTGPRRANLGRFAIAPFVSPAGRGNFTRPHLRAIYALTYRDEGARNLYAPDDPFSRNSIEHYLALSCEWWFNSSYQ